MLRQINNEHNQVTKLVEQLYTIRVLCESGRVLNESHATLNQMIRKVLITNKEIPTTLATVLAKVILYSTMIEELINRKRRYKKHSLLTKVHDHITDLAAQQLSPATKEEVDNVNVDIIELTKQVSASLTGKPEIKDDIQRTFDAIVTKLTTTTTDKNRVKVMKLASLIVQSNSDTRKRKQIIQQYLEEV